jgi:membrane protein YqaA with SNARE-associated domain
LRRIKRRPAGGGRHAQHNGPVTALLTLFLLIVVLNVLPAFAPPTWMVLSFFGLRFPDANPWVVALVAASAATAGRTVLASLAQRVADSRWFPASARANLVVVSQAIEQRRATSSAAFLLFAFSPFPSNALFLAYGLSKAPLALLAIPFFVGRFVSYAFAFAGGAAVADQFDVEISSRASVVYFVLSQLVSMGLVVLFARIDWRRSWRERRLRWIG